jgi:hypothetical protein
MRTDAYSTLPHPEQNRDPATLVRWQRLQVTWGPASGNATEAAWGVPVAAAGTLIFTFTGQPHPAGTLMPSAAAIPAAWMALNSRTLDGMKKHSMKPRTAVIPVQKKQQ